jgi:hypothetical protein
MRSHSLESESEEDQLKRLQPIGRMKRHKLNKEQRLGRSRMSVETSVPNVPIIAISEGGVKDIAKNLTALPLSGYGRIQPAEKALYPGCWRNDQKQPGCIPALLIL